ncbi:MAG TPA: response regulator [Candidatus Acidoferrales bacterium]|nr:response regulator [Candidatus Acidoferrales bacterium]
MSETQNLEAARTPTVYFIDDSATMREVIKIAFRKENIHVITCANAASALEQFNQIAPDVVITDVIMPDKDGYEVCEFIKQHDRLGKTPVILMSGVVNRSVAERATAVKADELIRKPFQPQDLIVRVKNLLHPTASTIVRAGEREDAAETPSPAASRALSGLFSPSPANTSAVATFAPPFAPSASTHAAPRAQSLAGLPVPRPTTQSSSEIHKLRNELRRLELFVKKLQAELEAEHQYCAALEAHFKALQESEDAG